MKFVFQSFVSLSLFFAFSTNAWGGSNPQDCYRIHLREAVALNQERAPLYAELTNQESLKVSKRMIQTEKLMIGFSYVLNFDKMAEVYEKAGIGVTCDAYISMSLVPKFRKFYEQGPVPAHRIPLFDEAKTLKRIRSSFRTNNEAHLEKTLKQIHEDLNKEPRVRCMTRHIVESMRRVNSLIEPHAQAARQKALPNPRWIHRLNLKSHIQFLKEAYAVDRMVLPINKAGIPMICQDVPAIEIYSGP